MARKTRSTALETRTARSKLTAGKYHWRGIRQGLGVGYRKVKGDRGGTWTVRLMVARGHYVTARLGLVDDHQDPNGLDVLSYDQAQERARQYADKHARGTAGEEEKPYTVANAIEDYLAWYAQNRKALKATRNAAQAHVLPELGNRLLGDLTTKALRGWHSGLAEAPARLRTGRFGAEVRTRKTTDPRARRATANRILTILKAALNHAYHDGKALVDDAWRKVRPFRNADAPKVRYLSVAECTRLCNACAPDFRPLVQAALLTGCRYGELTRMACGDYNQDAGAVLVRESKSGKPRHVPLTGEGQQFFQQVTAGRSGAEVIFLRADGKPWGAAHQQRPLTRACTITGISPAVSFHVLRHTYGSLLAMRGVPLQVIAEALGHADTRITSRHYAHLLPSYVADTIRANLPSFGLSHDNVALFKPAIPR